MTTEEKCQNEQRLLDKMILIYCKGIHKSPQLCGQCRELADYARQRSAKCPYMETKTFCSACKTHCYKPEKRKKIRLVMRYSGPRMLLHHPIILIKHALTKKGGVRKYEI